MELTKIIRGRFHARGWRRRSGRRVRSKPVSNGPRHIPKPLRKSCRIGVVATGTYLGAPGDRVPSSISPFDATVVSHDSPCCSPTCGGHTLPPFNTRNRINAAGRSGGLRGGKSVNRAPQVPRGSPRHGQSAHKRTSKSSRRISAPYFTASRASLYEPARLHASQRNRSSTYGKSTSRRTAMRT